MALRTMCCFEDSYCPLTLLGILVRGQSIGHGICILGEILRGGHLKTDLNCDLVSLVLSEEDSVTLDTGSLVKGQLQ